MTPHERQRMLAFAEGLNSLREHILTCKLANDNVPRSYLESLNSIEHPTESLLSEVEDALLEIRR